MHPDTLQRFVDQHPYLFAVTFACYFVALWCLVGATISLIGGWLSLSRLYRARIPFTSAKLKNQSGRMRWFVNYNNVLTLGANQEGLYLACMFLFRLMQPALLIPWAQIKVRRTSGILFEYATFTLDHELAIPLRIRSKVADRLREMAGDHWPIEET